MTLQQLEYVAAVYRFRHFANAADYCNVTQPTLSSMVQKLEEELGVKIFDRKKNPIAVTPIGQQIIDRALETLAQSRRVLETVEEEKHSLLGTFNIGILPTIAPYLIPRFFPQLMKKHPEMDIRVTEMKTSKMKQALLNNELDAGILALVNDLDNFETTTLYYEQFFAYVSREDNLFQNKTIRTSDLTDEYLWLLDEGHCFSNQLVKFCSLKAANASKKSYSLGSIETFMRIVESGKGVTFIPELATYQLNASQKELIRPFAIPIPTREIVMMTNKGFIRQTLLKMLVDEIQKCLPKEMLTLRQTQATVL